MKKLILSSITTIVISTMLFIPSVLAAPEHLIGNEKSTANLIELLRPEEGMSTFSNSCIVSGKARSGVKVTIYMKNDNGIYEKLMTNSNSLKEQSATSVSWLVGRYGSFAKEITLEKNKVNNIIIYAEKGDDFEIIKRQITVKSSLLKQVIKTGVVDLQGIVNTIIKE